MNTFIPVRNTFPRAVAVALGVVVLLGFARTYYLRFLVDLPPLTLALHLHGLLATAWMVLHYTQARLVATHRVALHRQLGIFTAVLGFVLVAEAYLVAYLGLRAGHAPPGRDPLQFFSVPFSTTTLFAAFLTAALVMRRKREWHKRLMFLATLGMLVPALGRVELQLFRPMGMPRLVGPAVIVIAFLAWACVNDWRRTGRVHPAYLYVGGFFALTLHGRILLGFTAPWMAFARWVAGL